MYTKRVWKLLISEAAESEKWEFLCGSLSFRSIKLCNNEVQHNRLSFMATRTIVLAVRISSSSYFSYFENAHEECKKIWCLDIYLQFTSGLCRSLCVTHYGHDLFAFTRLIKKKCWELTSEERREWKRIQVQSSRKWENWGSTGTDNDNDFVVVVCCDFMLTSSPPPYLNLYVDLPHSSCLVCLSLCFLPPNNTLSWKCWVAWK